MPKQLTSSDVQELKKFFALTELVAVGGNQRMGALPLSTGQTLFYYVAVPGRTQDVFGAHDRIRSGGEWAVLHDHNENRYELWVEGQKFGNLKENELLSELAHCVADPNYR